MTVKNQTLPIGTEKPDWAIITFMAVAHLLAFIGLFFFTWQAFTAFCIMYAVTVLGITFGFHRLFTHRSFKVPKWIEYIAALAGSLALQGTLFEWVSHHRMHHAHSDKDKDPHNASRGFWYSHFFWLCYRDPNRDDLAMRRRFARDIAADKVLMFMSSEVFLISLQVAFGVLLWAVWGFEVMMWGVWVRMVAVYHVTWLVNSAAHKWGYRNYQVDDLATNCWWVGLLAFGEGWHNNHHAYGNVAPAGHKWWEFDLTWQVIKFLRFLGLATDVKMPPKAAVKASETGGNAVTVAASEVLEAATKTRHAAL